MFELFFQKYKLTFCKGGIKSLTITELIMLFVLFASSLSILYFSILKIYLFGFLISSAIIIIDTIVMLIYQKRKQSKIIDNQIANYKEGIIKELIELLKQEQFNLYTLDGLDWMIKSCQEHIESKKETASLISTAIFPVFTLAYGVAINSMSAEEIAVITTAFIILIIIINILYKYVIYELVELIQNPDKSLYLSLKNELEYIKIQFQDRNINEQQ